MTAAGAGGTWLERLAAIASASERREFLGSEPAVMSEDAVAAVHSAVVASLYVDPARASRLVEACRALAEWKGDSRSRALAARCEGHLQYTRGDHEPAAAHYEQAASLFDALGDDIELGRTLSSGLQTMAYLGRYDAAREWAARAEAIFLKHGDVLRLARLDSNLGNIDFRQDLHDEAVARYERALEGFRHTGDVKDIGAVLINLAVCEIARGQFTRAQDYYRQARDHCDAHGLTPLAVQADYNIAYLYYLRGDYAEARRLYQISRERSLKAGDAYHAALCDLDESEMDLELNLTREGEVLAQRAATGFANLGMRYEQAKALVSLAVAVSQRGDRKSADLTLRRTRRLFVEEGNGVWPALIDLLRAVLAFHEHRPRAAHRLSSSAWKVLSKTMMPGRAAQCLILLARLWLQARQPDRARAIAREALDRLGDETSPSLRFHANMVQGEANEMQGRCPEAWAAYESARQQVEDLRGRVDTEDLRISILKDKLSVYDSMISMCLNSPLMAGPTAPATALMLVQHAKSRNLADRMAGAWPARETGNEAMARSDRLRQDLNWYYRQIELASLADPAGPPAVRIGGLRARCRSLEAELLTCERALPDLPMNGLDQPPDGGVSGLQQAIPHEGVLLEYFEARGALFVFLLSRGKLELVRLGSSAPVWQSLKLLQFQLGRFRLAAQYIAGDAPGHAATDHHLRELYRYLIAPVEKQIETYRHLIIASHRNLHGLPFAALTNGDQALIDRFTMSVVPSAAVHAACRTRRSVQSEEAVVMAVADPRAPQIEVEARTVAALLPNATVYAGAAATAEALRRCGHGSRLLHLAAHGVFRRDNPLFSSIQLADGRLTLFDVRRFQLDVDLLTLSACNTGSNVTVGGDELVGLMRGFLAAGARSLLVALWEINDASTLAFMGAFYRNLRPGVAGSTALSEAMREVKRQYRHPYYWAPFVLVGDSEI